MSVNIEAIVKFFMYCYFIQSRGKIYINIIVTVQQATNKISSLKPKLILL